MLASRLLRSRWLGTVAVTAAILTAGGVLGTSAYAGEDEHRALPYNVTRLDLDVEDNSLTNTAGIDRRNKAIRKVQEWAARHRRAIQFVYTIPTGPTGLEQTGIDVLANAVRNGARIDIVNIMTFDYYDDQAHEMAK